MKAVDAAASSDLRKVVPAAHICTVLAGDLGCLLNIAGKLSRIDLILPASVHAGRYRWCLTVFAYSGNHRTSCAAYTLTA